MVAKTPAGHTVAFKVSVPLSDEDLRRLVALQRYLPGAEWTGRAGGDVR